jgi:hypothetical protein
LKTLFSGDIIALCLSALLAHRVVVDAVERSWWRRELARVGSRFSVLGSRSIGSVFCLISFWWLRSIEIKLRSSLWLDAPATGQRKTNRRAPTAQPQYKVRWELIQTHSQGAQQGPAPSQSPVFSARPAPSPTHAHTPTTRPSLIIEQSAVLRPPSSSVLLAVAPCRRVSLKQPPPKPNSRQVL